MNKNAALLEILSNNGVFSGQTQDDSNLTESIALIVSAFVSNNPCNIQELPQLVAQTRLALIGNSGQAFAQAGQGSQGFFPGQQQQKQTPAVEPKKSIHNDYIICLEDGAKMKMLKRYIARRYNLTPQQYREKWGLAKDYPMVAPGYAAERSNVAKRTGLGQMSTGRKKGSTNKK
jgi:predicted transcriptional regulator